MHLLQLLLLHVHHRLMKMPAEGNTLRPLPRRATVTVIVAMLLLLLLPPLILLPLLLLLLLGVRGFTHCAVRWSMPTAYQT